MFIALLLLQKTNNVAHYQSFILPSIALPLGLSWFVFRVVFAEQIGGPKQAMIVSLSVLLALFVAGIVALGQYMFYKASPKRYVQTFLVLLFSESKIKSGSFPGR